MADEATTSLKELAEMHPADAADHLQRLPAEAGHDLLRQLPTRIAAEVLVELNRDKAVEVLNTLEADELAALLGELLHHQAADLVAEIAPEKQRQVLAALPVAEAASVIALLRYPKDTAGGVMTDRFITLRADQTVQQAHQDLRQRSKATDDVSYLYVTDDAQRLVGVVSLRELVFGLPEMRISDIMNRDVQSLRVDADQEEIARTFQHYHYLGLPVLDYQGRLVGLVKLGDALKVAQAEATEDMQLMVGLSGQERALTPWRKSVGKRLPWLYLNLLTGLLAAAVVGLFEDTIAQWTALALFLPIIAGQGGNAGMQTLTVVIRDMALGELSKGDGWRALMKELLTGTINGLAIGIVVGIIGYVWKGSIQLGVIAAIAMLLTQIAAALAGVVIPLGLKVLRVDPALAASIFVTTVTDVAGFFFFLGLAFLVLKTMS